MHRQVGDLQIDEQGLARRGLLVRHLVLPGDLANTEDVVAFLAGEISRDTYLNLMDQYFPCYRAWDYPPLDRPITRTEYERALALADRYGLRRGGRASGRLAARGTEETTAARRTAPGLVDHER
jgi:putative pyruvate formate lyase activating enzyme